MSRKGNIFQRVKKTLLSISKENKTKNTLQKAKSHEIHGNNRLSPVIASENRLLSFLSDQAY